MSYKDILGNGPPKLPPDLVESDEEDDEMPDLVTMDTADIPWDHIKTGYIIFMVTILQVLTHSRPVSSLRGVLEIPLLLWGILRKAFTGYVALFHDNLKPKQICL